MSEHFDREARRVIVHAQLHARRLGHHYVGCEHLLLAAVSSDEPAGEILRAHGLTPDRVEELIVQRAGLGAGPGLFADLDSDALAAIGIDVEAVRAHAEEHVTREALARADRIVHCQARPPGRRMPFGTRVRVRMLRSLRRHWAQRTASTVTEPPPWPPRQPGAIGPPVLSRRHTFPSPQVPRRPWNARTVKRSPSAIRPGEPSTSSSRSPRPAPGRYLPSCLRPELPRPPCEP